MPVWQVGGINGDLVGQDKLSPARNGWLIALVVVLVSLAMVSPLVPAAEASHSVYGQKRFPDNVGFLWMSGWKYYSAVIWVEHNWIGCNQWESDRTTEVWTNIYLSTTGQSSMDRWPGGVRMYNQSCNGALSSNGAAFTYSSNLMDTGVAWDQDRSHFNGIGGRVRRQQATPDYCAYWNVPYPCGGRAFVQINWNKWVGADGGTSGFPYMRREILHETGHSHGLIDCPSGYYGMMMNGSCGWDEGITGWNADDRASVSRIYP